MRGSISTFVLTLLLAAHSFAAQISAPTIFAGMCDASGAVALDSELFAIADDEDNKIRIYNSRAGGAAVKIVDPTKFLQLDNKEPEADLEGAARIGDRIYWITSHGRNRNAKYRESRLRFFATDIVKTNGAIELQPTGHYYANLLLDVFNEPAMRKFHLENAAVRAPKSPDGLNIEGLAATRDGKLLIGLRNPLPQGRAIVVPLLNPAEVIEGKPMRLGEPTLLDLGKRGVRAMTLCEGKFLIVAGAIDETADTRLFFWNGAKDKPERINVDLRGVNPEAIAVYPGDKRIQLFSDDGSKLKDGTMCKKLPPDQRSFRAVWLTF
jgi:hypothetical protein